MDAHTVGQIIKEARLAKKMTQSEVVGNFITRNMLSQIESGNALPSMKTLAYLSSVLDLPLSSLLHAEPEHADTPADCAPPANQPDIAMLPDTSVAGELALLKSLYTQKDYTGLLSHLSESAILTGDPLYDEKNAFFARAAYECALQFEANGSLAAAIKHAKNAAQFSALGIYANQTLKADALLLLARLAEELGKQYE